MRREGDSSSLCAKMGYHVRRPSTSHLQVGDHLQAKEKDSEEAEPFRTWFFMYYYYFLQ